MARYFFHLNNGLKVEDVDGEDFDLVAEARGHAVKVAQELGRHGSPLGGRSISVTGERGCPLQDGNLRRRIGRLSSRLVLVRSNCRSSVEFTAAANHQPLESTPVGKQFSSAVMKLAIDEDLLLIGSILALAAMGLVLFWILF
jgi:hypothetical protein